IGGRTVREHLELIDCARAVNFITTLARQKQTITLDDICTIHTMVSQKIDASLNFADFMQWLHTTQDHPVIIAALAHYKLVTIHPFIDGPTSLDFSNELRRVNVIEKGKMARLLMNLLLLQHGYPLAIIKKEQRSKYIAAIEHAWETDNYDTFYEVIIQAVEYRHDIYLEVFVQS